MRPFKITQVLILLLLTMPAFGQAVSTGTIKGRVLDKATKQPLPGAIVSTKGASPIGTATDSVGGFVLSSVPEGVYFLVANYTGYQEKMLSDVKVTKGKTNYLEIEVEEAEHSLKEVKITTLKFEKSVVTPVSAYSFSREEISLNPGAQGDIFRAIGMLPGVSSSGGEYSAIAVRGQGVRDNVYMVDDIPVTEVGHLEGNGGFNDPNGGRFSIFAPRVIDNALFVGGGFGAEYGRRSASYLGLDVKEGNRESSTIDGQVDLFGLTVNYDGPSKLFKNTSLFVSARYQDFRAVVSLVGLKGIGVPQYGDFIFKSVTDLNAKNKLSLIAIVAPERYTHNISDVLEDKTLNNLAIDDVNRNKIILGMNLRTLVNKNSYWKNVLYFTTLNSSFSSGTAYPATDSNGHLESTANMPYAKGLQTLDYTETKVGYRSVYTVHFHDGSRLTAGIEADVVSLTNKRNTTQPDTEYVFNQLDYRPNPKAYYAIVDPAYYNASYSGSAFDGSAYVNYTFPLFKKLTVNAGLRYDYTGFADQSTASPRLSASYPLSEKASLNFATGIYNQDPVYSDIADQPKDKKLKEEQITQLIIGYKKYFTPDLKLTIEGWYKTFDHLVVRPINGNSYQNNDGTGWGEGIDVNVTKRLTKKLHGQIGYSYMQSRRDDHDGLGVYDFTFSQPHQVNFLVSYKTGKHWLLSTKFRYATGKPTSRYVIHSNVFDNPNFIRYSQEITGKNDTRLPDFMSWDIRANYQVKFRKANLTFFVDIVDVLNRQIANGGEFNAITGSTYYDGIAIFPSFGMKFEF